MKEQYRYSVNTSIAGGGITVSLQRGGHGMELLRHFTLPKEEMAASAYELRLRRVADILNPHAAVEALEEAAAALDVAQAEIESEHQSERMRKALRAVRQAIRMF